LNRAPKRVEEPPNFVTQPQELALLRSVNVPEAHGQEDLGFDLPLRATRDIEKSRTIGVQTVNVGQKSRWPACCLLPTAYSLLR
jgi:hypothetical protein